MIYLCSPYTSLTYEKQLKRYKSVLKYVAKMIDRGYIIYSPIVYLHHIAIEKSQAHSTWLSFDRIFLEKCDEVWILMLDGWERSEGIKQEIEWAKCSGKPIKYVMYPAEEEARENTI